MKGIIRTLLVAVSGSTSSLAAAKYGIVMAKMHKCRLVATYVVDTATLRELLLSKIFVEEESADYEKSLESNGQRYLNYVEELARKKGVQVEKSLRKGSISTEIVEAAQENEADIVLVGGFEDKGIMHDAISRQSRDILKNAECSVLVVKQADIDSIYQKL
jgi:nucleotide-binding universal stress UspA family protein